MDDRLSKRHCLQTSLVSNCTATTDAYHQLHSSIGRCHWTDRWQLPAQEVIELSFTAIDSSSIVSRLFMTGRLFLPKGTRRRLSETSPVVAEVSFSYIVFRGCTIRKRSNQKKPVVCCTARTRTDLRVLWYKSGRKSGLKLWGIPRSGMLQICGPTKGWIGVLKSAEWGHIHAGKPKNQWVPF